MALGEPGDYVLASGVLHGLDELCATAFATVGLDWRDHVRSTRQPGDRPALVGDPRRAERELGWERRHSFAQWIGDMVAEDVEREAAINKT
jgi:GDPmannose 4,6-dehydratase